MGAPDRSDPRRLALRVLTRIDDQGAYANLVLRGELDRAHLDSRDAGLVTDLVYGTTRMQRACDWLVDRFLTNPDVEPIVRTILRMGAYQLVFRRVAPHAAVSTTVELAPRRARGLVNAVLRRVAEAGPPDAWPSDGVRLSYPDWIVARLSSDLGRENALDALEAMNRPAEVTERADGYIQDQASQWVADLVGAREGERVLDLCAAPGGKATALAGTGATVVAADLRERRTSMLSANAARLGLERMAVVTADGRWPPFAAGTFDRVLVDAPCSGLGVLHGRPDARWRISADDVASLAILQSALLDGSVALVRPGGTLVYSVCTLTDAETLAIDEGLAERHPSLVAEEPPGAPWSPHGRGALLLPQTADTDGMFILRLRRSGHAGPSTVESGHG